MKFFRCIDCRKFRVKTNKTYEIVVRGEGYEFVRYMCNQCGDPFNEVYEAGKKIADEEAE